MLNDLPIIPELNDRQFQLVMRRLSNRLTTGLNASIFLGTGHVFQQSRGYLPGDPVRTIDWRVLARTGRLHVKEYETHTHTPVYILVDDSASMSLSAGHFSKYAVATLLAGGLAWTAIATGNPVSLMASNDRACPRPTTSTGELSKRLHMLRRFSTSNALPLGRALARMRESLSHRSLVLLLSDLHDECAAHEVKTIAVRHEVIAIQLLDRMEVRPLRAGIVRLRAAEGRATGVVTGSRSTTPLPDFGEALRLAGVPVLQVQPERDVDPQVRSFLRGASRKPWNEFNKPSF